MPGRQRISRRTVLQGAAGAALALPVLEAMTPAAARGEQAAAGPRRLVFIYKPGGLVMPSFTPRAEGADYELPPTLAPLAPLKDDVLVLSGLDGRAAEKGDNGHPLGCSPWLSSAPINEKDRGGYCTDISIDQLAAAAVGERTRLPSLEVGCAHSASQAHISNISWRGPASPMGKEVSPRAVFARVFGDPIADRHRAGILDLVLEDAARLERTLGAADRQKMEEYLDSVRSVERRMQLAGERPLKIDPPEIELPEGVPGDYDEHVRLMSDLIVLALQADATRVVTFMLHNEDQIPPMPHLGIKENHHGLAHNGSRPGKPPTTPDDRDKVSKLEQIDRFYVGELGRMLQMLKDANEGEGTLLDNSMVLFGSGLSWGNLHVRTGLPLLLAGRGGGTLSPGRHIRYSAGTPFANLHLALLERMGASVPRVADSSGPLQGLAG